MDGHYGKMWRFCGTPEGKVVHVYDPLNEDEEEEVAMLHGVEDNMLDDAYALLAGHGDDDDDDELEELPAFVSEDGSGAGRDGSDKDGNPHGSKGQPKAAADGLRSRALWATVVGLSVVGAATCQHV